MNTVIAVLLAVGATFLVLSGTVAIGLAYWEFRKNLKSLIESTERLGKLANSLESLPHLCNGIIKICDSLAENAVSFNKSVSQFHGDLFPGAPRKDSGYQPYSDEAASTAYLTQELIERGIPPDLARQKVAETFTLGG